MRWRYILTVIGILILIFGITMVIPLAVGLMYGGQSTAALAKAMGVTIACGLGLWLTTRGQKAEVISQREGMAIVAVGWSAAGLFGALPFYFSRPDFAFVDAVFESVSGFTTTGSSILTNIEAMSKGLLLWRSLIQWLTLFECSA